MNSNTKKESSILKIRASYRDSLYCCKAVVFSTLLEQLKFIKATFDLFPQSVSFGIGSPAAKLLHIFLKSIRNDFHDPLFQFHTVEKLLSLFHYWTFLYQVNLCFSFLSGLDSTFCGDLQPKTLVRNYVNSFNFLKAKIYYSIWFI